MESEQAIFEAVRDAVAAVAGVERESILANMSLSADLNFGSIDMLDLIVSLEKQMPSVFDFTDFIAQNRRARDYRRGEIRVQDIVDYIRSASAPI